MAEFVKRTPKSILNKKKFIDSWFWDRYTLNPYNGCLFGCIYCDARRAGYHMPEDFENSIIVKEGAAALLDQKLARARTFPQDVVGIGGVTDAWQAAEKKFEITRQCLKVLARHRYPVHAATKSDLVLRDLDVLEQIASDTWCTISITITSPHADIARFLDHRSPSPQRRFEIISQIKAKTRHVQTGVLLIPMIPLLADSVEDLTQMVKNAKSAGADYLLFGGGMTLGDKQALWFLNRLQSTFSELMPEYERLYGFKFNPAFYSGTRTPAADYLLPKHQLLLTLCKEAGLPCRIPRFLPNDDRLINYRVAEVLLNKAWGLQMRGQVNTDLYWAGQNIQNHGIPIDRLAQKGELASIRNVRGEILQFVEKLILSAKTKQN